MFQPRCTTYHSLNKPTAFSLSCLFTLLRSSLYTEFLPSPSVSCHPSHKKLPGSLPTATGRASQPWVLTALCLSAPDRPCSVFASCWCYDQFVYLLKLGRNYILFILRLFFLSGIVDWPGLEWAPFWWSDSWEHNRKIMLKKNLTIARENCSSPKEFRFRNQGDGSVSNV